MQRTSLAERLAGAGTLVPALLAPFVVLGVLRFLPATPLDATTASAWLGPAGAGTVAAAAGAASVALLVAGLRGGTAARLALAAAAALVTASLALEALAGPAGAAGRPHPETAAALAGAALLLAMAAILSRVEVRIPRPGARILTAVGLFLLVEAMVYALSLIGGDWPDLARPLQATAVTLVAAAALIGGGRLPFGAMSLVTAAMAAGLLARHGSLDVLVGDATLAAGAIGLLRWSIAEERPAGGTAQPPAPIVQTVELAAAAPADDERREAARLARELRGAIEELLAARRTIELQRAEIERAATVDPLTGVMSRSSTLERLRMEVAQARRYAHPVALLLLDVDGMRAVNAVHGLAAGDQVLRELALRMRLRVRDADALGRAGADAFLAILPHTDESGAATFAEALRRRVTQRPISTGDASLSVTVSIGVAILHAGEDIDSDGILARVDEALASARAAGGDRIAFDRLHGLARLEGRRGEGPRPVSVHDETPLDSGA